jgi:hypothetical protein
MAFAVCFVVAACGGGAKTTPMVADSPVEAILGDASVQTESSSPGVGAEDGGAPAAASGDALAGAAILQGNEEGAQALLKQFVAPNADYSSLTRSLRPTTADFKSLFDAGTATKIETAQAKDWDSGKAVIKPKPNQTEVKIWSATGADLATGKGNAKEFPPGYKKLGKHLAAAVTFYRFKFVEAGKDTGTAYDGLAFVNGHWVIAPKPWRAIDGSKGPDKDDDESAETTPASKPKKPKGKKR